MISNYENHGKLKEDFNKLIKDYEMLSAKREEQNKKYYEDRMIDFKKEKEEFLVVFDIASQAH